MKFEKLGNRIKQIRGISYKPNQISDSPKEEYMPVLKANNITPDGLDDRNLIFISNNNVKEEQIIKRGDILLAASSGSKNIVGKNIYFNKDYHGSFGAFCKLVRPDNTISSEFLSHFFHTDTYKNHIKNSIQGANINNLKNEHIDNLRIPVIPFKTQLHIANILTKAESLIVQRKESIRLLDEYLKSVFLEMFGDPVRNERGWKKNKFGDYILKIIAGSSYGGEQKELLEDDEFGVLKVSAVTWGVFNPKEFKVVNKNDLRGDIISPNRGDLLFSRANTKELVGATCIVDKDYPKLFLPDKLWKILLDENELVKPYIHFLFKFPSFKLELTKGATGTSGSMLNISMEKLRKIKIPVPPLILQNKFAQIVEKTEAVKAHYQQSLQELENLYGSLSQKAFKGELCIKDARLLLAAEPKTKYTLKPDLKEKECSKSERAILAAYILHFYAKQNIGRVHLMKLLHLTEYHCQINIHSNFVQEAAGPYDNGLINDIEQYFIKYKLYSVTQDNTEKRKVHYTTISPNSAISELFYDNFQDEALRINQLLEKFKNWSMVDCEVASTLYAVWNNRILSHKAVGYSAIKQDFLKWSPRKKSIINKFDSVYNWMYENKVIPVGYGGIILKVA